MIKYLLALFLLLVVGFFLWKRVKEEPPPNTSLEPTQSNNLSISSTGSAYKASDHKSQRSPTETAPHYKYTHSSAQLHDFILPNTTLDGVSLREALETLRQHYLDTCYRIGERPLEITFDLPEGETRLIYVNLRNLSLTSCVRYVTGLAGATFTRDDAHFSFQLISDKPLDPKMVDVPSAALKGLFTRVYMPGQSLTPVHKEGVQQVQVNSTVDENLVNILKSLPTSEVKSRHTPKVIEIPSGSKLEVPKGATMSQKELVAFLQQASESPDVTVETLPTIVAPSGQPATIELVEAIPTQNHGSENYVGRTLGLNASAIGLGQNSALSYLNTRDDLSSAVPRAETVNDLSSSIYNRNGNSQVMVEVNPDGSRSVIVVTQRKLD